MIRLYRDSDFEIIKSWWVAHKEAPPTEDMLPKYSTFVMEIGGKPRLSIAVYTTGSSVAYLEAFIKDPLLKNNTECSEELVRYAEEFARSRGHKYLVCLSFRDKLKHRYQELGYRRTTDNLSSFCKEL